MRLLLSALVLALMLVACGDGSDLQPAETDPPCDETPIEQPVPMGFAFCESYPLSR